MAGKYQAYPEHKDSGVDWLGDIPLSWGALPIKMVSEILNGATPKSGVASFWGGDISWVTPADLGKSVSPYISKGARSITAAGYNSCGVSLVPKDSVVLASRAPIGTLGIASNELCTNQGCKSLVVKDCLVSKFLYYVLISSTAQLNLLGRGSTFLELSADDLGTYKIPSPSEREQQKIVSFLDHETAKIDTLIDKQQQLIQLLKEKRQAVISHAVTKGLNPSAPMRDSGVEWLGEVPEHWKVGRIGYFSKVTNGATPSRENLAFWTDGDIGWLNSSKINDVKIATADQFITPLALSQTGVQPVKKGDVLMAITGEGQTRGRVAICLIDATINQHLAAIKVTDKSLSFMYLFYYLKSQYERIRHESSGTGSTRAALTCADIALFPLALPPLNEQEPILEYIIGKEEKLDALINLATIQVGFLQERRTALISAAVTGKIDVRGFELPQEEKETKAEAVACAL